MVQAPVSAGAAPAEAVAPAAEPQAEPVGVAQAAVARVATEAVAATASQPAQTGQEGAYAAAVPQHGEALYAAEGGGPSGATSGPEAMVGTGGVDPVGGAGQVPGAGVVAESGPAVGAAADAGQPTGQGVAGVPAQAAGEGGPAGAAQSAHVAAVGQPADVAAAGQPADVAAGQPAVVAAADAGQVPGAAVPVPDAGPAPQAAAPTERAQAAETTDRTQTPETAAPVDPDQASGAAQAPETGAVPASVQAPETGTVPETVQSPESPPPPTAQAPEPVAPANAEAPEAVVPVSAPASEAVAPENAQVPEAAAPGTTPVPARVDVTQAQQPADSPAPAEVPSAAVPAEPSSQPAEPGPAPQEQSAQPVLPDLQPAQGPQSVPAFPVVPDPEAVQAVTPEPGATDVEAQEPPTAATPEPPAGHMPDVQPAPLTETGSVPAESAQPTTPAPAADSGPAPEHNEPTAVPAEPQPALTTDAEAAPNGQAQAPDPQSSAPVDEAGVPAPAGQTGPDDVTAVLPGGIPPEPQPDQPLGQFVPVEGSVPTTPHLAPTPPHAIVLPTEEQAPEPVATVPAPREADAAPAPATPDTEPHPDVVQNAEDLDTRAADQEEDQVAVEDVRESTGPAAPAYDDAEREAVLKVMRERRDIRNGFRSDPIPHEVLLRVLEAAHTAPSVGHSQPWDFVVIRSAETRRSMHELAMRQRDAYAKSLPKGRAKQFKELKIEAILDTPVNIVVTADPTRGGRHTLGRHTQPQMAPYSSALAVENLWLAARAEGLGVGWVSFFDEREMVRALGLPEHLEVVAYLCVGYVDEFPEEPELMQAGWSKRRPLSWVVHEETYGRRALPGEEPHDLLAETVAQIRPLDAKALGEAWERQKRMTKPAGALGMLEIISAQLSGLSRQCPPPIPEPAAVAIFAGDHGVHAQGVTPWPQEVTAQMVANFLGGGAVCNAFAGQVGAEVCVVDVGVAADLPATPGLLPRKVRAGTSDMTTGPAMTREEAKQAIEVGIETARDLVAAGNKALLTGEMGIANTTASAALISVFTGADPSEVTGRGTGINDETLARKTEVVRRALEVHKPDPADPIGVLAAIGGFEHAAMVGLLLGGASLRTPVILDGVSAGAAALVARAIAPEVLAACIAGHRSAEPGHVAALNKLGLRPLVDLDLRLGEGTGALLALPLVQSTARAMHEVATFDSAGVTEK